MDALFPKSRMGRPYVKRNLNHSQSHTEPNIQIGATGESLSNLRPAGIALIEGKRVDVMADADWIEAGKLSM